MLEVLRNISSDIKYHWLRKASWAVFLFVMTFILAEVITKGGFLVPFALIGMVLGILILYLIFLRPQYGITASFIVAFAANGLGRYISAPFGLTLDIVLVLTLLAVIFSASSSDWKKIKSPVVTLTFIWFILAIFQIFNPEARSFAAWFYAVRGIALYMMVLVPLVFLIFDKEKDYDRMIYYWFIGGIVSALYGMKQLYIGLNAAENAWLAEGAYETQMLFGRLRVFSFFSDAGQFGAFMGYTGIVAIVLALGKSTIGKKLFFMATALICFYGMAISGTRGALFVPVVGFFAYLFLSKNFKILILGVIVMGSLFFVLKYTFIGQGNYQVQRMRSALNPDDPSFQVRLENQRKYKEYLRTRPFGGGIGSAGYWGERFSPGTFLAETPTDSHYVRIWAETGIVGLVVHLGALILIMGISFFKIYKIPDPRVKQKLMAIYAGCFGIVVASYGNQVVGQMPTNVFFYISLSFLYIGCQWSDPQDPKNTLQNNT